MCAGDSHADPEPEACTYCMDMRPARHGQCPHCYEGHAGDDRGLHARADADVLSDATSRALYDAYGAEGMRSRSGAEAGRGNAREVPCADVANMFFMRNLVPSIPRFSSLPSFLLTCPHMPWKGLWMHAACRVPLLSARASTEVVLLQAWDEFKPYKRENKRTRARDVARASASQSFDDGGEPPAAAIDDA